MARTCRACHDPHRKEIDAELVQGYSHREIARRYGFKSDSIWRHSKHVAELIEKAERIRGLTAGDVIRELVDELRALIRKDGSRDEYLRTCDRLTRACEVFAKITGEIQTGSVATLFVSLGVSNEAQLRSFVERGRIPDDVPVAVWREDALAALEIAFAQDPTWRETALARLNREPSSAEVVNGHELGGSVDAIGGPGGENGIGNGSERKTAP